MENTNKNISFDPADFAGMIELMDKYGDVKYSFFGENECGERVRISIHPDMIVVETYQHNDWTRINTYYRDGSSDETFTR